MEINKPETLKAWMADPENQSKVAIKIEERKIGPEARIKHEEVWEAAKAKFDLREFPQEAFDRLCYETKDSNYHKAKGKVKHPLKTFRWSKDSSGGFKVEWLMSRCEKCNKSIVKKGVLLNSIDNLCFVKNFVDNNVEDIDAYVNEY